MNFLSRYGYGYTDPRLSSDSQDETTQGVLELYNALSPKKLTGMLGIASGVERDTILPFAQRPTQAAPPSQWNSAADVMRTADARRGGPWELALPQFAVDAVKAVDAVGSSGLMTPYTRSDDAREYMTEQAGAIVGPQMAAGFMRNALAPRGGSELGIFGGRLAKTADQAALAKAETLDAAGTPREQIWNDTGWFKGVDGKWRFEIDDSGVMLGSDRGRLDRVMPHDQAYAAYPDIAKTPTSPLTGLAGLVMGGGYSPPRQGWFGKTSGEMVYSDVYKGDARKSKLLHETQHAIQDREKFADGGSPQSAAGSLTPEQKRALVDREIMRLQAEADTWNPANFTNLTDAEKVRFDKNYREGRASAGDKAQSDIGRLAYNALAGEVEARAVQKRMDLTPDQRRARAPWLDYDVPEAQQIVRYNDGGPQPVNSQNAQSFDATMTSILRKYGLLPPALAAGAVTASQSQNQDQ